MPSLPFQRKIHHVLQAYGVRSTSNHEICGFSKANEVVFVRDVKGRQFVLKNNLKNRSPELLALERDLVAHLVTQGCGAPEFLFTKEGDPFVHLEGEYWTLCHRLKGRFADMKGPLPAWQVKEMVRGLGAYHRAATTFDRTRDTSRIKCCDFPVVHAWTEDLAQQLVRAPAGRASVTAMIPLMDRLVTLSQTLKDRFPADLLTQCEVLMVHGDFHCHNVAYRYGRFSACFDFDFLRRDLKLFDVASALLYARSLFWRRAVGQKWWQPDFNPSPALAERVQFQALSWFLGEYLKEGTLSDAEITLLPEMEVVLLLNNLRYFSLEATEEECTGQQKWYGYLLDRLDRFRPSLIAASEQYLNKR